MAASNGQWQPFPFSMFMAFLYYHPFLFIGEGKKTWLNEKGKMAARNPRFHTAV